MARAFATAQLDERIRALLVTGSLARGDADEWSAITYVAVVTDEAVPAVLSEIARSESLYGQSLVTFAAPQRGVDGGGYLSVLYLQSGLPLQVHWYLSPRSLGLPVGDTKPLFTRESWPQSGASFADLLRDHPNSDALDPPPSDLEIEAIVRQVGDVARGRPEVVARDGVPAEDQIAAYDELSRRIADLPSTYGSDVRAALFYYLGVARRGF
jgi:hypothetical protein